MGHHDRNLMMAFRLSAVLAILLFVASTAGVFVPGLYRDPPVTAAQMRGVDLVTLVVALPMLVTSLVLREVPQTFPAHHECPRSTGTSWRGTFI